jgi:hypothetical protein
MYGSFSLSSFIKKMIYGNNLAKSDILPYFDRLFAF